MTMKTRRDFIRETGLLAGAAALFPGIASFGATLTAGASRPFGIQLYTLRDLLPGKAREILRQLAEMGYSQVESYEGPEGIYWNHSPGAFKRYLDDLGLQLISTHCNVEKDFEKKVADAAAVGMKYVICPWVGPQPNIDAFKKIAAGFNEKGALCKKYGIRFAYHNHDYSFKLLEGQIPQTVLLAETDPTLVDFEMDLYWVNYAGQDIRNWLEKYPNRFKLCHVKDKSKYSFDKLGYQSVDLGTGSIDFKRLLPRSIPLGMDYFFVEQEFYPNGSSLEAAAAGAGYMKRLRF